MPPLLRAAICLLAAVIIRALLAVRVVRDSSMLRFRGLQKGTAGFIVEQGLSLPDRQMGENYRGALHRCRYGEAL